MVAPARPVPGAVAPAIIHAPVRAAAPVSHGTSCSTSDFSRYASHGTPSSRPPG